MIIQNTTDGKYIGVEVESLENPVRISEDLLFQYDKKIETETEVILANSNYIINIKK